jgi:hypothetical protein
MKKDKTKKLGRMVAPVYTLILTPNGSRKAWPPLKTPQNDGYVYIINMHVCNTTNRLKYKRRRIRRRRITPTRRTRRDKKRRN